MQILCNSIFRQRKTIENQIQNKKTNKQKKQNKTKNNNENKDQKSKPAFSQIY